MINFNKLQTHMTYALLKPAYIMKHRIVSNSANYTDHLVFCVRSYLTRLTSSIF